MSCVTLLFVYRDIELQQHDFVCYNCTSYLQMNLIYYKCLIVITILSYHNEILKYTALHNIYIMQNIC